MKKALIYASVASMIDQFNRDNIQILLEQGYEVHVACNFEDGSSIDDNRIEKLKKDLEEMNVPWHHVPIPRDIKAVGQIIKACKETIRLFKQYNFSVIHMHSPIGAAIGRIAAFFTGLKEKKIIYTAHGFHFYEGAPTSNWFIFFPLEYILSFRTDTLITINMEDYERAQELHAKEVRYVPGVGVVSREATQEASYIRQDLGFKQDELVILSIGELNVNKNHREVIMALENVDLDYKYVICGQGDLHSELQQLVNDKGMDHLVQFLGYREDISNILAISDIFCLPSHREGLSVGLMEAMTASLPCVVSNIRGNRDLIDSQGGYLFDIGNEEQLTEALVDLIKSEEKRRSMGQHNSEKIKKFSKSVVNELMADIYKSDEGFNVQ